MRLPVLALILALLVSAATGCVYDKAAVSYAIDACTYFGRLRVDRSEHTVPRNEVESRLDQAVRAARKAAGKDADWSELARELEHLRELADDPAQYDQVESKIWATCGSYVGT